MKNKQALSLEALQRHAERYVLHNRHLSFSTRTGVPHPDDTEFAGKDLFHIVAFWDDTPHRMGSHIITATNVASARADTLEAAFRDALSQLGIL